MPRIGSPHVSIAPASCKRFNTASVPGLTVSPHSLSRGKLARSIIRTRAPCRASNVAATAPAGPAPTMTTSTSGTADDERAVLRAESETVAERGVDLGGTSGVRNEVEIALRILIAEVDGGRKESAI